MVAARRARAELASARGSAAGPYGTVAAVAVRRLLSFVIVCLSCRSVSRQPPAGDVQSPVSDPFHGDATMASAGSRPAPWPPAIDARAFGTAPLGEVALAAFSQTGVSGQDPQVLALRPDLLPRA